MYITIVHLGSLFTVGQNGGIGTQDVFGYLVSENGTPKWAF